MGASSSIDVEPVAQPPVGGGGEANNLLEVVRRLSRPLSLEEIMREVSHGVRTLLHADGASVILRDRDRCYYAEEDAVSPLWKGRRFPMSACISGWCMTHDQAVAIPDIDQDPRIPADAYRPTFVRSLAMAPVRLDEPIAALGAYWGERRQPRPEEMETLQALADSAALAIANLQPRRFEPPRRPARPEPPRDVCAPKPSMAADRRSLAAFLDRARREGLRPNSWEAYAFAVLCVTIATLARFAFTIGGVEGLVAYAAYYPAVLIATLAAGGRAGLLTTGLGGLAAFWFFAPPAYVTSPVTQALNLVLYGVACALIILIISAYKRALRRLKQEDARHLTLVREQHHRVRNAIAVVEGIVQLSLRDEPERAKAINRRVRAGLAQIDIRDRCAGKPVNLRELLTTELQPYELSRFTFEGEADRSFPAERRDVLSLALHELTTNALKYGALSVPEGRVTVAWRTLDGRVVITWREAGGPPVTPPQRRGYGFIMLRRMMESANGAANIDFQPTGVTAEISFPV